MKTRIGIIIALVVISTVLLVNLLVGPQQTPTTANDITSFEECVTAGNPVMESYPRQCRTPDGALFTEEVVHGPDKGATPIEPTLTQAEAETYARASDICAEVGPVTTYETYNTNSSTWWFTLASEKQGCNPACVVYDETGTTEVNWRCTGAIAP